MQEFYLSVVHLIRRHFQFPGVKCLLVQLIHSLKSHEILVTSMLSLLATLDMHYTPRKRNAVIRTKKNTKKINKQHNKK